MDQEKKGKPHSSHAWVLFLYDLLALLVVSGLLLFLFPSGNESIPVSSMVGQFLLCALCVLGCRMASGIYRYVWRYGGTALYLRLMTTDAVGGFVYYVVQHVMPVRNIAFVRAVSLVAMDLLLAMFMRLVYQFLYEVVSHQPKENSWMRRIIRLMTRVDIQPMGAHSQAALTHRINVAIIGAGRVGAGLAEELVGNPRAAYLPCCFIDTDKEKIGRTINGIPVYAENEVTTELLASFPIQEIIFALPELDVERKRELFELYKTTGCKIKVYDYPTAHAVENGRRHLRDFDIEELLFRQEKSFISEPTASYYRGKTVLITGGGGSIGGELCRQIARMQPKQLIVLDVYENCAYDVQQELRIAYGNQLNLAVEILNICDRSELDGAFAHYRPDVVLHAAAHKHVPLMEHNCVEAVKNNVFGTLNVVDMCEKYGVEKAIMVSTDKAVNPTNVMGATKRMCEMIFLSRIDSKTSFTCTRFGNVLGSNGSVIPLFKRQIMNGGPVTLTDKRIIRYFMTIPEASQLVLTSGAMAKHGELFVLDMGKPVKILDLAENMIRLSGFEPYRDIDIIETGLRPGEKLYEELLMKTEELDKTDNHLIFVERDKPLTRTQIEEKLAVLHEAVETGDNELVRRAMKQVVPTFHSPSEVNKEAEKAGEMQQVFADNTGK